MPVGVSRGSNVTNRMPSPAPVDSAAAYLLMNRMAALALAYPPLRGDPATAPMLDIATTTLPGASGSRSAARVHVKTLRVSTC